MRKVIAAINMTLDGFCDHTAGIADEETHQHYTELLRNSGTILYGRITYQLMESYWPTLVKNPSGQRQMDEFAVAIDNISKVVFSRTLKDVDGWKTARLATRSLEEEVLELRKESGKDILAGCRSLIVSLLNHNLIDEFQLCVHPVIAGKGLALFENITDRIEIKLLRTKTFGCGAMIFYYEPIKNKKAKAK
jgi:dihydrofolate reductase